MRILLGLCVVLLLGGCNRVHSERPLFNAADQAGAPVLRDGLWLIQNNLGDFADDDCRVSTRKPANRWPDCADWMIVRGGEILGLDREEKSPGEWVSIPFVLAGGEPAVFQFASEYDGKPDFNYFGMEPLSSDAEGRVIAFRSWPALCGPPPPPTPKGAEPRYVTLDPMPGLAIVENNCTAETREAVLASARASRAWDDGRSGARWIRDTYP